MTFADFLHWLGTGAGASGAGVVAALYRRFVLLESTARDFAALIAELQAFPAQTRDAPAPTHLAALKRYIDALRVQLAVPHPAPVVSAPRPAGASGLSFKDAAKLAEIIRKVEALESKVEALAQRTSGLEDDSDIEKKEQAHQWAQLGKDLAWLRGKLNLPSV